ncbi:hypothetical protein [Streptomyces hokutonensis]|uniref:hypothetical protein n=1 Tax=Streptomyces hokutonensis TaxID=1306990 RepID=UPI003683A3D0
MSQEPGSGSRVSLSKEKKVAVGVGGLIAASLVVLGVVYGGGGASGHSTSAAGSAPGVSPGGPAARTPATHASASASGPAQKLADLDGTGRPAAQYQQVLDALAPRCTQDRPRLAVVAGSTLEGLKKNGVDDEDAFGVLQHLEQSVPAGNPRVNCASAAAAYATQREGS